MNFLYRIKRTQDLLGALPMLMRLKRHEHWKRQKLEDYQHERLLSLIHYAVRHSPFYRELYGTINIEQEITLDQLPIIDKTVMMDQFDRFVTDPRLKLGDLQAHIHTLRGDDLYLGQYRVLTTSGSSGLKGVFVFNRKEWRTILAGYNRCALNTGIIPPLWRRLRECTIFSDNPAHASWRMKVSGRSDLTNSMQLAATSGVESHIRVLNDFQPDILSSYPSIISLLAIEQMEGRLNIHPKMVGIAGETMTKEMELNIRKAWGIIPFNVYGSTEGGAFNMDCALHRGIHIAEDLTILEIVDEKHQPVPAGSPGFKVLITNLFNYTQPLIRYEISDMLTLSGEPCPCGRPFKLIDKINGRNDDIIYLPDIRGLHFPVHPLHFASVLGSIDEIREYRVVQEDTGLTVSLVLRNSASEERVADEVKVRLPASLQALGVICPDIRVRFITGIERSPNTMGKVKLVQAKSSRD